MALALLLRRDFLRQLLGSALLSIRHWFVAVLGRLFGCQSLGASRKPAFQDLRRADVDFRFVIRLQCMDVGGACSR